MECFNLKKNLIITSFLLFLTFVFIPFEKSIAESDDLTNKKERYFVMFKEKKDKDVTEKIGALFLKEYNFTETLLVEMNSKQAEALKKNKKIKIVEKVISTELTSVVVTNGTNDPLPYPPSYDRMLVEESPTYTGKGVNIAVLDSGVDATHEDLNITTQYDCDSTGENATCREVTDPQEEAYLSGHGTHVISIINGQHNTVGVKGIAPNANIYSFNVNNHLLGFKDTVWTANVIEALETIFQINSDGVSSNDIHIVNMSFGSSPENGGYDVIGEYIQNGYNNYNILFVASTGNDASTSDGVYNPARINEVIAVGALDFDRDAEDNIYDDREIVKWTDSNEGPATEVSAFGHAIPGAVPLEYDTDAVQNGYTLKSGTSQATPMISGILALYKEQFPNYTNVQLRQLLRDNTLDVGDAGKDDQTGYGMALAKVHKFEGLMDLSLGMIKNEKNVTYSDELFDNKIDSSNNTKLDSNGELTYEFYQNIDHISHMLLLSNSNLENGALKIEFFDENNLLVNTEIYRQPISATGNLIHQHWFPVSTETSIKGFKIRNEGLEPIILSEIEFLSSKYTKVYNLDDIQYFSIPKNKLLYEYQSLNAATSEFGGSNALYSEFGYHFNDSESITTKKRYNWYAIDYNGMTRWYYKDYEIYKTTATRDGVTDNLISDWDDYISSSIVQDKKALALTSQGSGANFEERELFTREEYEKVMALYTPFYGRKELIYVHSSTNSGMGEIYLAFSNSPLQYVTEISSYKKLVTEDGSPFVIVNPDEGEYMTFRVSESTSYKTNNSNLDVLTPYKITDTNMYQLRSIYNLQRYHL